MKYSEKLQEKINQLGLKKENILYLPIAQTHLRRIVEGSKKVEFREFSLFYCRKIFVMKGEEIVEDKPITHVLFQGGYKPDSPRVLSKLLDVLAIDEDHIPGESETGQLVQKEADFEGFEEEDAYIAFVLGNVEYTEGF